MCANDSMCNERFLFHAVLVTTLKTHMCLQQSGCVLWLFSLLRFLWFGFPKVLLSVSFYFIFFPLFLNLFFFFFFPLVAHFAYEILFNYWNFLSIQSFCGIQPHCTAPKFPCSVQEDGLDSFLRSLQCFISEALHFYCFWGVGAIQEVLICVEYLPMNYSLYFAIWLPDN